MWRPRGLSDSWSVRVSTTTIEHVLPVSALCRIPSLSAASTLRGARLEGASSALHPAISRGPSYTLFLRAPSSLEQPQAKLGVSATFQSRKLAAPGLWGF